jgi:hypothetical protein
VDPQEKWACTEPVGPTIYCAHSQSPGRDCKFDLNMWGKK